ncbi:hypothetical protein AB833_17160 [Chromatiales bacterium (ex Bugula neritina AB1)]|nr:hypothetical protein AB833_17160 [Chromatiales bacterium (ex Bugula neritina AB1)]
MLPKYLALPLLLAITQISCTTSPKITDTVSGTVTKVHDGDSIHITPSGKKRVIIRLAGIDAPELAQPFGMVSRDMLRSMILNRPAEARCHKQDKYHRQVCVVYFEGEDINLQMVKAGMAWHYKFYQDEQSRQQRRQYSRAERDAREDRTGLWDGESIAPWVFRRLG